MADPQIRVSGDSAAVLAAVEEAAGRDDTNYALGSVLNHVLLHQTIIGEEARKQLEMVGDYPDMVFDR